MGPDPQNRKQLSLNLKKCSGGLLSGTKKKAWEKIQPSMPENNEIQIY